MVRTNPPGALVYVDNQQIGTTPCAVDFTYYGTREIRMIKPGFETLTVNQPIPTPWYQLPGIDFFSENLVPMKIRDNRTVSFNLMPQRIIPTEELIGRGQQLRAEAGAPPAVVPAGATVPITPGDPFLGSPPPTVITPAIPGAGGPPPQQFLPPPATAPQPFRY